MHVVLLLVSLRTRKANVVFLDMQGEPGIQDSSHMSGLTATLACPSPARCLQAIWVVPAILRGSMPILSYPILLVGVNI